MKMVNRIHLDPAVPDTQLRKQPSRDRRRITEQWIKVRRGIERVALAPEGAAIAADHVMLLDEQYPQPSPSEQIRANQTSNASADDHGVVKRFRLSDRFE